MAYNRIYNEEDWALVNQENKDIMEDYLLEYTSRKKKKSTIEQYRNDLRIILIYILKSCNNQVITSLTKKEFRNLSLWFSNGLEVSNARTNRLMSCCRSLLTFVEEEDEYDYDTNIAKKVKGLEKESVRDIIFLKDEIVLKLIDKMLLEQRYKDATLLALAYDSAGRKGELAQCTKYSFLDEDKNSTNKVVGKRGKVFQLVYFNLTKKCVKLYLEQRGQDDIDDLFVIGTGESKRPAHKEILYDWVVAWRKDLKELFDMDCELNVHSLRHTSLENFSIGSHYVCRDLGIEKIPLEKLRLIANHSNIGTTASYLQDKSTEELENLFGIKI